MGKWSKGELDALAASRTYEDFGLRTGYSKSYDAWEVKRRRAMRGDPNADRDAAALLADLQTANEKAKVLRTRVNNAAQPEIGNVRITPDVVNFEPVFFDIESTGLKANFGRVLCVSGADMFGNVTTFRADDPQFEGKKRRDDSKLVIAVRDWLETFDILIGWNSKLYDVPFLNSRLLIAGERPIRADIMHVDPMWKAGQGSLALHSRRLDAVAKTFRLSDQKTVLDFDIWQDAAEGERDAMDYIVQHCEADVLVLRSAFHVLKPLIRNIHR